MRRSLTGTAVSGASPARAGGLDSPGMIRKAKRMEPIRGFGIDRVAVAADAGGRSVLRMENLDTDLPLPPEAVLETVAGLATPEANSWLPFTGDLDLRAAISEFTEERTGHR